MKHILFFSIVCILASCGQKPQSNTNKHIPKKLPATGKLLDVSSYWVLKNAAILPNGELCATDSCGSILLTQKNLDYLQGCIENEIPVKIKMTAIWAQMERLSIDYTQDGVEDTVMINESTRPETIYRIGDEIDLVCLNPMHKE